MAKKKTKPKKKAAEQVQRPKDFLDMIAPAAVQTADPFFHSSCKGNPPALFMAPGVLLSVVGAATWRSTSP